MHSLSSTCFCFAQSYDEPAGFVPPETKLYLLRLLPTGFALIFD